MNQLLILLLVSLIYRKTFTQVTIAKNTQVTPRCGSQLISIEINFDPNQLPDGKFTDWIVVGVSGRPECRLRGNGETKYIIEIAVFNDPCLTQIPARNVFQNRVRIGKNPVVILEGDQSVTVKCVYGLPTVETLAMPVINPNFNIDNLGQATSSMVASENANPESGLTSSFSNNENVQSVNAQNSNTGFQSMNTNQNQFLVDSNRAQIEQNNMGANENFATKPQAEIDQSRDSDSIQFPNTITTSQFTNNPIRPQIQIGHSNNVDTVTSFPTVSNIPQQPQQGNMDFGLTATGPTRRSSFSIIFLLGIIFIVIFVLLLLACLYFFLKKKRDERSRRLLMDGVSSADEGKRTGSRAWWTDGSTDGTIQGESVGSNDRTVPKNGRSATASIFDKKQPRSTESREVPIPTVAVRKNQSTNSGHYARANVQPNNNNRHNSSASGKTNKKSPAPPPPRFNLPLRSNLEEFVSKTYAMGEYNNDLASPAYAYSSTIYDEREVDIGFGTNRSTKIKRRPKTDEAATDDTAVSSYRSITEIVHAAETANISRQASFKPSETMNEMERTLIDCVLPIRGFGYRKLTEQEMGRWKNLIQKDGYLRNLLIASKSAAEIEDIFEGNDYKNMFSSTKWHEIAQCVHRALTNSLDRTNSQSQLQLFVGNVHSDW